MSGLHGRMALPPPAPSLRRRLACFLYEGVLLFGVVMTAGLIYAAVTRQTHALVGMRGLQAWLFVVLGIYFAGFWARHGQTLAMRTWHIRLEAASGGPPGLRRALLRYLLSWMWFLPALLALQLSGLKGGLPATVVVLAGIAGYAALSRLRPDRQYWHDVVSGTRLVDARPPTPGQNPAP